MRLSSRTRRVNRMPRFSGSISTAPRSALPRWPAIYSPTHAPARTAGMLSSECCDSLLAARRLWGSGITEPNGPLRDALAHGGKEPFGARRSFRPMERYCPWLSSAERYRARYGFEREPNARRTGEQRLERPLCLHLLVVPVQPVRRPRTVRASSRHRPQRRWLG
jgi:hypothetical protein